MSVYFEAVQSGRIKSSGWSPTARLKGGTSCKGIRNAVKRLKHVEAERRNAKTPYERTKARRRELERLESRVTKRDAATRAEVRRG